MSEVHHIVPVCLGGPSIPANLVKLYPAEHYVAHKLLVKMHPNNTRLWYAAAMMAYTAYRYCKNAYTQVFPIRTYKVSKRDYECFKDYLRDDVSKRFKGKIYVTNGLVNKVVDPSEADEYVLSGWTFGKKPMSKEAKEHIKLLASMRTYSPEQRENHSDHVSGKNNPAYGTKVMNNGIIQKRVGFDQLDDYLKIGWKFGVLDSENRKKRIVKATRHCNKKVVLGRKSVHTEVAPFKIRRVRLEDYDYYINVLHWKPKTGTRLKEAKINHKLESG